MRKDAKIGFAIGGVLLAVLTVYVIVVPKHPHGVSRNGVTLVSPPGSTAPGSNTPGESFAPAVAASDGPSAPAPSVEPAKSDTVAKNTNDNVNWAKLLNGSSDAPTLFTTTPTPGDNADKPAPATANPAAPSQSTDAAGSVNAAIPVASNTSTNDAVPLSASAAVVPASVTLIKPATQPAATGHVYVIKPGQTLSSIAAEVYGNQRFYVAILRANPSINPARIRPGMKVLLPDISEVRPESSAAMAVKETPAPSHSSRAHGNASSGRSYTVVSGDTLYRISKKIYGSQKQADAIYSLNEETIGADKAKLKVGMVLTLPDAPGVDATASTR